MCRAFGEATQPTPLPNLSIDVRLGTDGNGEMNPNENNQLYVYGMVIRAKDVCFKCS